MAAFPYLDLAIGVSFVYLLLALICTTVNETISGILNSRGKNLAEGITELLQNPTLMQQVYAHPLISGVQQQAKTRLPSYISSSRFAVALMDTLTGSAALNNPVALRQGIESLTSPATKAALTAVLQGSPMWATDQQRIAAWYDDSMNRVSGWYKRTAQIRVFVLAAIVTLLMNADTLHIISVLWYNPTTSAAVLEGAKVRIDNRPPNTAGGAAGQQGTTQPTAGDPSQPAVTGLTAQEQQALQQFTGWKNDWYTTWSSINKTQNGETPGVGAWLAYLLENRVLGWIITIIAVSLGAPFWFDTLSKFMNLRNTGKVPETITQRAQDIAQTQPAAPTAAVVEVNAAPPPAEQ